MMRRFLLFSKMIALVMSVGAVSQASAQDLPSEFEIASDSFEGWSVKATTEVRFDWTDKRTSGSVMKVPFFGGAKCEAQSDFISFAMDETLEIEWMGMHLAQFRTAEGTAMPRRVFELQLDDELFHLGYGENLPTQLFGFEYPPIYERTPGFTGYSAYRRPGDEHWKPVARLFDRLMTAKSARLGTVPIVFGDEDDDKTMMTTDQANASLNLSAFQMAANWCQDTLRSPAAVTLPDIVDKTD